VDIRAPHELLPPNLNSKPHFSQSIVRETFDARSSFKLQHRDHARCSPDDSHINPAPGEAILDSR
jgi:hypothetical protein